MLLYIADQARDSIIYVMHNYACMEPIVLMKVAAQWLKCLENFWAECAMANPVLWPFSIVMHAIMGNTYLLFHTVIRCINPPDAPAKGQRNATGLTFGSTLIYSCTAGYTLNGSSTITCMANRQWSGKAPDCSRKLVFNAIYVYQASGCVHTVYQYIVLSYWELSIDFSLNCTF